MPGINQCEPAMKKTKDTYSSTAAFCQLEPTPTCLHSRSKTNEIGFGSQEKNLGFIDKVCFPPGSHPA